MFVGGGGGGGVVVGGGGGWGGGGVERAVFPSIYNVFGVWGCGGGCLRGDGGECGV